MPFTLRPYRRFPVQCFVSYSTGPFTGGNCVESLIVGVETLRRSSATNWRNLLTNRESSEPTAHHGG
jgi:hypothetical protein